MDSKKKKGVSKGSRRRLKSEKASDAPLGRRNVFAGEEVSRNCVSTVTGGGGWLSLTLRSHSSVKSNRGPRKVTRSSPKLEGVSRESVQRPSQRPRTTSDYIHVRPDSHNTHVVMTSEARYQQNNALKEILKFCAAVWVWIPDLRPPQTEEFILESKPTFVPNLKNFCHSVHPKSWERDRRTEFSGKCLIYY